MSVPANLTELLIKEGIAHDDLGAETIIYNLKLKRLSLKDAVQVGKAYKILRNRGMVSREAFSTMNKIITKFYLSVDN